MNDFLTRFRAAITRVHDALDIVEKIAAAEFMTWKSMAIIAMRVAEEAWRIGENPGPTVSASMAVRGAVDYLVSLTHDVEVVVPLQRLFTILGIDLAHVLPDQHIEYPGGNEIVVRQTASAVVAGSVNTACHPVQSGQLGLDVPLEILVLTVRWTATLAISFDLRTSALRLNVLEPLAGFGPKACQAPSLPIDMRNEVLLAAEREITRILAKPGQALPDLDFGLGRPSFYAAGIFPATSATRIFGQIAKRPRAKLDGLDSAKIPNWADMAIKFHSGVLTRAFQSEVASQGLDVESGPRYSSLNQVDYTVGKKYGHSVRIGCFSFGVSVSFMVDIRCQFSVVGISTVRISALETDRRVDVVFSSGSVGILEKLVGDFIAKISKKVIAVASFDQRFRIPKVSRLSIEVDSISSRLYAKQ